MNLFRGVCLTALVALGAFSVSAAGAEPRQHYGPWEKNAKHYFHREYYFKPTPKSNYEVHHVVWYPAKPQYYYYWNPAKQVFWGRAPVLSAFGCYPVYSMLAPEDRKPEIKDIPETAFPKATTPPTLAEAAGVEKVKTPNDARLKLPQDGPPLPFVAGAN